MPHDPQKLFLDIKECADRIVRFANGRTFDDFVADDQFRSAVERQFEIIGEAMTRLRKIDKSIASKFTSWEKIISFRNILIHDYEGVDHSITWSIIRKHLPILRKEIGDMLIE